MVPLPSCLLHEDKLEGPSTTYPHATSNTFPTTAYRLYHKLLILLSGLTSSAA